MSKTATSSGTMPGSANWRRARLLSSASRNALNCGCSRWTCLPGSGIWSFGFPNFLLVRGRCPGAGEDQERPLGHGPYRWFRCSAPSGEWRFFHCRRPLRDDPGHIGLGDFQHDLALHRKGDCSRSEKLSPGRPAARDAGACPSGDPSLDSKRRNHSSVCAFVGGGRSRRSSKRRQTARSRSSGWFVAVTTTT